MPELRKDPIVGRWVIIAPSRAERPNDFEIVAPRQLGRRCPFCEGNEGDTPDEVLAYRNPGTAANQPGWRLRVVPNKFPALEASGDLESRRDGFYTAMDGVGAHEVIIESPRHLLSITEFQPTEVREMLDAYRDRLVHYKRDPRMLYGLLFKNVGPAAGASLEHAHSQLIVTPIVPVSVWEEMTGALEYYQASGSCVYCDVVRHEAGEGARVVLETPDFLAICPYASRFAYETWILPKRHTSHFDEMDETDLTDLGQALQEVTGRIETRLNRPAYNYFIHTSPFDARSLPHYHWHLEIMPALTKAAGFEWGTGFHINPVSPERAAAMLRS